MKNWKEWVKQNSKKALWSSIALGFVGIAVFSVLEQFGAILFLVGVIGVVVTLKTARPPKTSMLNQTVTQMKNSPVLLKEGERTFLCEYALRRITKNRVVGQTAGFGGLSIPVGGGVRARVGGAKASSIYGDVSNYYRGEFVLTNLRIVFVASQYGFEFPLEKVSAITGGDGNSVLISTPKETCEMVIAVGLKPKQVKKFLSGDLNNFSVSSAADRVLLDMVSKIRAAQ